MKGARSDNTPPSRRGRRRIVADRVRAQPDDPSATVIEANRHAEFFRAADGGRIHDRQIGAACSAFSNISPRSSGRQRDRNRATAELSTASTSALLKSLVELGYLDHDRQTRSYLPTVRVALLGGWLNNQTLPGVTLDAITHELRERTADDLRRGAQSALQPVHPRAAGHDTGTLLSRARRAAAPDPFDPGPGEPGLMNDEDARRVVQQINAEEAPSSAVRFGDIQPALATIRRQGFAYARHGNARPERDCDAADRHRPDAAARYHGRRPGLDRLGGRRRSSARCASRSSAIPPDCSRRSTSTRRRSRPEIDDAADRPQDPARRIVIRLSSVKSLSSLFGSR